jgi:hypothetical protein
MSPHKQRLLLAITLLVLTTACASSRLPETRVEAKTAASQSQQNPTAVAAIVKAKKANLRDRPSHLATVTGTVNKGDLLTLTDTVPVGPWYRVRAGKSRTDDWIHGNAIALLQTADGNSAGTTSVGSSTTSDAAQRPRTVSAGSEPSRPVSETSAAVPETSPSASSTPRPTSGKSYVNVDGVRVPSPVFSDTRPAGASARCRDGSYSFSLHRRGTCSHHGGVAEWY